MNKAEKWRNNKTGRIYYEVFVDFINVTSVHNTPLIVYTKVLTVKERIKVFLNWLSGRSTCGQFFVQELHSFIDKFTPLDTWKMQHRQKINFG